MNSKKFLPIAATAVATALTLAGCGASGGSSPSGTSMPGMDHGSSSSPAAASGNNVASDHNAADVMFAQMMIPHHAQAVEMSEMILKKQDIPAGVISLATRIKAAQGPEIEKMTGWLSGWGEPAQMPSGQHSMDGMMGADDMSKLEAAPGLEAAKLFLTQMITHHEGAVTMAKTESKDGKNSEAIQLSKDIVSSQEAEIQEMKELLANL